MGKGEGANTTEVLHFGATLSPLSMRKITFDSNTKWQMVYNALRRAKGRKRKRLLVEAFEIVRATSFFSQFNEKNAD